MHGTGWLRWYCLSHSLNVSRYANVAVMKTIVWWRQYVFGWKNVPSLPTDGLHSGLMMINLESFPKRCITCWSQYKVNDEHQWYQTLGTVKFIEIVVIMLVYPFTGLDWTTGLSFDPKLLVRNDHFVLAGSARMLLQCGCYQNWCQFLTATVNHVAQSTLVI